MKFLILILAIGVCSYTATATITQFIPRIKVFGIVSSKLVPKIRYLGIEEIRQNASAFNKGVITFKYPKVTELTSLFNYFI